MEARRVRLIVALAAVLLVVPSWSPGAVRATHGAFDEALTAELQGVLDSLRASRPLPGIAASVVMGDERWHGVSGVADVGSARALTLDTPFVVGSITKTFVAALVLDLAEDGVLSVDDPLARWIPEYPDADDLTLRQLLAHTSGLADYFAHPDYERLVFGRPRHVWTLDEILALVGTPTGPPGSPYHYSNTNYVLLGEAVQRATGRPIGALIRERYLEPLGMSRTWFQGHDPLPEDAAHGYLYLDPGWAGLADGTRFRPNRSAATVAWAAGAMLSTTRDLSVWVDALYSGAVLSAPSLAEMVDFGDDGYGLGAREYRLGGRVVWGHGGSLRGYVTTARYLPAYDITLIVATNRGRVAVSRYAERLGNVLFRHFHPDTVAPVPTRPRASIPVGGIVSSAGIPVELAWSAVEEESGIARWDLVESVSGGPWTTVPLDPPHVEELTRMLVPGQGYAYRVQPTDRAGHVGEWAASPMLSVVRHQERSRSIDYGGSWTRADAPSAYGGRLAWSKEGGATARLSFTGTGVAWVARRAATRGRAEVSIDGSPVATVDLAAPTSAWRSVVFSASWDEVATHTIEIRVLPTPGRQRVDLDALLVVGEAPLAAP